MRDFDHGLAVKPERSGWRDLALSDRHRQWGFNCPAVDLDFVLCEYDRGEPYALVEYKRDTAAPVHLSHPTMRALGRLADRATVPFFLVTYSQDFVVFRVVGVNYLAQRTCATVQDLSEQEYVAFLLALRGRQPNGQLF